MLHRVEVPAKVGFWGAASANVLNMVGVGPFLTIPLALAAMGGPQAMLGWILGALLSLCDGMVWAELGSAMPVSGGPYHYLLQAFGPHRFGRLFSFLFLWQAIVLGPISIAGGAVGFAQYAAFLIPNMHHAASVSMAAAVCLVNTLLLCRNIRSISYLSIGIAAIVIGTTAWIILTGLMHFHPAMAFDFPAGAFHLNHPFFLGLDQPRSSPRTITAGTTTSASSAMKSSLRERPFPGRSCLRSLSSPRSIS